MTKHESINSKELAPIQLKTKKDATKFLSSLHLHPPTHYIFWQKTIRLSETAFDSFGVNGAHQKVDKLSYGALGGLID